jgi:hypothetical protein
MHFIQVTFNSTIESITIPIKLAFYDDGDNELSDISNVFNLIVHDNGE